MAILHPDKVVGVTSALGVGPKTKATPKPAGQARMAPPMPGTDASPDLIENLAFQMHENHWTNHLARLARRTSQAMERAQPTQQINPEALAPKPKPQQIVIQIPNG